MTVNFFQLLDLAGRALSVQRSRLSVVSSNLANAQTTRTPEGGPYRRKDVMLQEAPASEEFGANLHEALNEGTSTVELAGVEQDAAPPRMVFDPGHPDADGEGFVAYPNINTVEEMVNMITIMRSYQANLSTITALKEMAERALGIGRS